MKIGDSAENFSIVVQIQKENEISLICLTSQQPGVTQYPAS